MNDPLVSSKDHRAWRLGAGGLSIEAGFEEHEEVIAYFAGNRNDALAVAAFTDNAELICRLQNHLLATGAPLSGAKPATVLGYLTSTGLQALFDGTGADATVSPTAHGPFEHPVYKTPAADLQLLEELRVLLDHYVLLQKTARRIARDLRHAVDLIDRLDHRAIFTGRYAQYEVILGGTGNYHRALTTKEQLFDRVAALVQPASGAQEDVPEIVSDLLAQTSAAACESLTAADRKENAEGLRPLLAPGVSLSDLYSALRACAAIKDTAHASA
jgi:hypothetical protein